MDKKNICLSFDVAIVGAGFSGLSLLYHLRKKGFTARVVDIAKDVGGTWYWNRYPGARCDTESMQYSYSFSDELQQEWNWSERYATQPEILDYINHVTSRFDLRKDISFSTRVTTASFREEFNQWFIETDRDLQIKSNFLVMATGCLSSPFYPEIQGLKNFKGSICHTGRWPHSNVEFKGKKIGVIGTGSSAIQSIPVMSKNAEHVYVFQRTANFAIPAHNGPIPQEKVNHVKSIYPEIRKKAKELYAGFYQTYNDQSALEVSEKERNEEYERRWQHGGLPFFGAFTDLTFDANANETAAEFVRTKIKEIVKDPIKAKKLSPQTVIGCKRLCVDTDYYATFNRENVSLIDIKESPIEKIAERGVIVSGQLYEIDLLVLATGFDAMTGSILKIDIRGRGGRSIQEKWSEGPKTFLGLMTEGFPNFFMITGPQSPSVLTNMLTSIEQHIDWICDCLIFLREQGIKKIEPKKEIEDNWVEHCNTLASETLRYKCTSWYLGVNIPGKPRIFMPYVGGFPMYKEKCDGEALNGYPSFELS